MYCLWQGEVESKNVDTNTSVNVDFALCALLPAYAPLEARKEMAKMKSKQCEELSQLMKNVLECFNGGLTGEGLHSCVEQKVN